MNLQNRVFSSFFRNCISVFKYLFLSTGKCFFRISFSNMFIYMSRTFSQNFMVFGVDLLFLIDFTKPETQKNQICQTATVPRSAATVDRESYCSITTIFSWFRFFGDLHHFWAFLWLWVVVLSSYKYPSSLNTYIQTRECFKEFKLV